MSQQPPSQPVSPMGAVCPQCNAAVQLGQAVCTVCGSHLQAGPPANKTGAGTIVAIIYGVLFAGIVLVGILASMLLPALARAKAKANRIKCVNNVGNVYKSGLAFAQDNSERLPWQLHPMGVRNHFGAAGASPGQYGMQQTNPNINEVMAHPNSLAAAGVYGLTAMKSELVTPKTLHSPCDSSRAMNNETVQMNWMSYDTKAGARTGGRNSAGLRTRTSKKGAPKGAFVIGTGSD